MTGRADQAQHVFDQIDALGIDITDVFLNLENDGVNKFEKAWQELLNTTTTQLEAARS